MEKIRFIFTGFSYQMEFRVFAFESVTKEQVRSRYTVQVDLALARKCGIRLQELPLHCLSVLERGSEENDQRAFVYTESDMCLKVLAARALEEGRRKGPRGRPLTGNSHDFARPSSDNGDPARSAAS